MALYSGIMSVLFLSIVLFGVNKNLHNKHFLSVEQTTNMKGASAFIVVLCHIYPVFPKGLAMRIFNMAGFIAVALFFFYSGYGLIYSVLHKSNYLKSYLTNRYKKMYIPLWVSLVVSAILKLVLGIDRTYTVKAIILDILGLNAIWFFGVIVVYYFIFWLMWSFVKSGNKLKIALMVCFIVLQNIICAALRMDKQYFTSSGGFVLGLLMGIDEHNGFVFFKKFLSKAKKSKVFMIGFAGVIALLYALMKDDVIVGQLVLRNIVSTYSVIAILIFLYYFNIGNSVLYKIGANSYEIFLIHPTIIAIVKSITDKSNSDQVIMSVVILISSFFLAAVTKTISDRILLYIRNRRQL